MQSRIFNFCASRTFMVVLLLVYALALGVATFIEHNYDTATAKALVYNNLAFFALQLVMVINFVAMSVRFKLWQQKKWGVLMLHYGFVVILCGAMTTYLFGLEGIVHVREGERSSQILDNYGKPIADLPFDIQLDDFVLETYSGSGSPSSYESFLTIEGEKYHAYMNNVVYKGAYRIYQSSYDKDLKGSVLTVNRDLVGMIITYLGYFMLFLGMVLSLFHKGSRFRRLASSLGVLIGFSIAIVSAQEVKEDKNIAEKLVVKYAIEDSISEKFSTLMVQTYEGRIEPIDTYARELLRKLNRKTEFRGLSSNQVLLGIVSQPELYSRVDLIKIGNDNLSKMLGVDGDMVAFVDVIDSSGVYKLQTLVDDVFAKPVSERSKFDKEVLKLDEKVNILHALFNGRMLNIFPLQGDAQDHWYAAGDDLSVFKGADSMFVSKIMSWFVEELQKGSGLGQWDESAKIIDMIDVYQEKKSNSEIVSQKRIQAELLYNKLDIFKWCGFGFMGIGLVLMIVLIVSGVANKPLKWLTYSLISIAILLFLWQNFGMGLRWYVSQRAPWTNSYESMVYIGWAAVLGGLLFVKKSKMVFSLAVFMGGAVLFVSNLSFMDPQITPLVPVLKSYWLIIHVAVITASYGFFGLGFLLGIASLVLTLVNPNRLKSQIKELVTVNELALWIGLVLMTAGTFLGAIWANESWGRYWGWDPKETWALVTMIVYAAVLHINLRSNSIGYWAFSVISIFALGTVLMTFFGVNYYLSGLHSYGSDSAPAALNIIWYGYGFLTLLAIVAFIKVRKVKS